MTKQKSEAVADPFPRRRFTVVEIVASYPDGDVGIVRREPWCRGELEVIENLRRFPIRKDSPSLGYGQPIRKRK